MKTRVSAALIHFSTSVLIALAAAGLVFGLWYPYPFSELLGGRELFLWLISVDVVIGPLLTFVIFNTAKPRQELVRDVAIIVVLQLCALLYGLYVVMQARPVWVACEGDRFRVVRMVDINIESLGEAPEALRGLSWSGPKMLAVRLAKPTDPEYLQSIQASIRGDHPAFRPSRWLPYSEQKVQVLKEALPVNALREKKPSQIKLLDAFLAEKKYSPEQVVYMPMITGDHNDWIVLLHRETGELLGYIHVDGWLK